MHNQAHIHMPIKLVKKDTFNTTYLLWKRNIDMHTNLPQFHKITTFRYNLTLRTSSTTKRKKKRFRRLQ